MSEAEEVAAALAEVVELGPSSERADQLGTAVSHVIAERPDDRRPVQDPAVAAGLRALARGEPCPLCGRRPL